MQRTTTASRHRCERSKGGKVDVVRNLIDRGASIDLRSNWDNTALSLATEQGYSEIQSLLMPQLPFDGGRTGGLKAAAVKSALRGEKWQIPPFEVELLKSIDEGNAGGEYLAKWLDADVLVKLFVPDASDSTFADEVRLWKQLRHPNILKLYGACDAGLQFFICEFASHGSVAEYLRVCDPDKRTPWKFMHQAALGLAFLHERNKVHGSLRCSNILVGSDGLGKLANFGLSRFVGVRGSKKDFRGAARWKAPEWFTGREPTIASDVYSFGLCILEAVTGNVPWIQLEDKYVNTVKDMWRPESIYFQEHTPGNIRGPVKHFTSKLCCLNPSRRVSIKAVICDLEEMAKWESREESADFAVQSGEIARRWKSLERKIPGCSVLVQNLALEELKPIYKQLKQGVHSTQALSDFHDILGDVCDAVDVLTTRNSHDQNGAPTERDDGWVAEIKRRTTELQKLLDDNKPRVDGASDDDNTGPTVRRVVQLFGPWMMLFQHEELSLQIDRLITESPASNLTPNELDQIRLLRESVTSPSSDVVALPLPLWFLPKTELRIDKRHEAIAEGSYGKVLHAKWLDSTVVVKEVKVAEKKAEPELSWISQDSDDASSSANQTATADDAKQAEMLSRFKQEADIWFGLSHPHVVQLLGASHFDIPFFVCEYATNGILVKYVRDNPSQLWLKLLEAALGLQYLHERGIVHGDLKGNNIMIGSDGKTKVTDFGLSWAVNQTGKSQVHKTGVYHWIAPECHDGNDTPPTFESDVYALGMCMIEAMRFAESAQQELDDATLRTLMPWRKLDNPTVKVLAMKGELPVKPERCTREQWALVESMCRRQPSDRIKITTVVDKLAVLAEISNPVERSHIGRQKPASIAAALLPISVPDVAVQMTELLARLHKNDDCCDLHILCQIFELLWKRLQCVWATVNVDEAFHGQQELILLVGRVREDTEKLQTYRSLLVLSTEAALRAFAAHRSLDKFLSAHFLCGKDGEGDQTCDWKSKCYSLLGIEDDKG